MQKTRSDYLVFQSIYDELRAIAYTELLKDAIEVRFNGRFAYSKAGGNLLITKTLGNEGHHLPFPV